ncbi:MAG: Hsp20/alpha crystallin family protein [bacterium]|nr:Hsp20/alpha crystallin family protein [candidate division KSB1 bacterium]MDH7561077.1 Hsp20/alpha crystallin family protein [bacterium]
MAMQDWDVLRERALRRAERWARWLNEMGLGESEKIDECNWAPRMDVVETESEWIVSLDLPGVKKEDVKVNYHDGLIVISGEKKKETVQTPYLSERVYGRFCRSLHVPSTIDPARIEAQLRDGVLKVILHKSEAAKPKSIEVVAD